MRRTTASEGASKIQHRKHRENREQIERDWRNEPSALTGDVAAGHYSRAPGEHRQRPPDLSLEIEQAGNEILEETPDRPVDMRLLPACVAVGSAQPRSAVETEFLMGMTFVARFAGLGLDRAREQSARHRVTD